MNCTLCGKSDFELVSEVDAKTRQRLLVSICSNCGLVQQTPMPTPEELRDFYAHRYRREYKGVSAPKPKHVLRAGQAALDRLSFLLSAIGRPEGSLLDIGAAGGEFLYVCRKIGFESVQGIEPNEGYSIHAKEALGVEIQTRQLSEIPEGNYDVITMFHVLEHLRDPKNVFMKLHSLMAAQGLLFIEVPWIESNGQSPANIYFKAHTLYFSVETLRSCASQWFTPEFFIDTDTGNLRVLFRRKDVPSPIKLPSVATVASTRQRLQAKGWVEYLFIGGGFAKFFRKMIQTMREQRIKRMTASEILDNLIDEKGSALRRHTAKSAKPNDARVETYVRL